MRKVIHIDADCFFASVELLKKPHLANFPVAVGGNPRGRGVITTCNYVARAYGVRSAMPSSHALRICPQLEFFEPNMSLYKEMSQRIMMILRRYTDKVQVVSIDEAFLDVTNVNDFHGSATFIARDIQRTVKAELGLNVSAGVAPNKYLAKIASDWKKPAGVYTISPSDLDDFLPRLELGLLPGVGPKTLQKLHRLGFYCCKDLVSADRSLLFRSFGALSVRMLAMANGSYDSEVVNERELKSISVERTFSTDITSSEGLIQQIPNLLTRLDERFSRVKSECKPNKRVLKLKFSDFTYTTVEAGLSSFGDLLDRSEFERLAHIASLRARKSVRLMGLGLRFGAESQSKQLKLPLFG